MAEQKRVLHIKISGGWGGIESFIYNVYKNIDRTKIQFDFVTDVEGKDVEDALIKYGAVIYRISNFDFLGLIRLMKKNKYQVVHIHKNSATNILPFLACKIVGVKTIIAHSHNTAPSDRRLRFRIFHYLTRGILRMCANYKFACSHAAAEWLYGKKYVMHHEVTIIKNGIEYERFLYDIDVRNRIRKKLQIGEKTFVLGSVGRLMEQKNPLFIIQIFAQIKKREKNAKLIMCGDGYLKKDILKLAEELNVQKDVILLGICSNVNEILQAMDVFVMPSIYEGLGIVAIEAQASGLPTIVSDRVPVETKIISQYHNLALGDADKWAEQCLKYKNYDRENREEDMINSGYNIKNTGERLEQFYETVYN